MPSDFSPDILIAGAGLIGLCLAFELEARGARVAVLETGSALRQASAAAAGMLAAGDPHNPPALLPLSQLSIGVYPAFLQWVTAISGLPVPFQTDTSLQYSPDGSVAPLAEHSIDPRQLAAALHRALPATSIMVHEQLGSTNVQEDTAGVLLRSATGLEFSAATLVHATGAWAALTTAVPIVPRKGQMLLVALPHPLHAVHRDQDVYIVPRTSGPQAGSALIGATLEDAGFDLSTHPDSLAALRESAARLLPALANPIAAPQRDAWAGVRPATPDLLPLLGLLPGSSRQWIASGHFRNGILLAPATARVIADALEGKVTPISLQPFSPSRFEDPALSQVG